MRKRRTCIPVALHPPSWGRSRDRDTRARTVKDIIGRIGVPMDELGLNIFLNGEYSDLTRPVRTGDRWGIFPNDIQILYKWHFKKKG